MASYDSLEASPPLELSGYDLFAQTGVFLHLLFNMV